MAGCVEWSGLVSGLFGVVAGDVSRVDFGDLIW